MVNWRESRLTSAGMGNYVSRLLSSPGAMSYRRVRRTAPLRVSVGLIVCLVSAVTTAEPTLVPPDEVAGLLPVVEIENLDDAPRPLDVADHPALRFDPTWSCAEPFHHSDHPGTAGESLIPSFSFASSASPVSRAPSDAAGLLPVIRAQSPEIDLLPLATEDVVIENTSLLRAVTGTRGRVRADWLTDFDDTERIGVQAITQVWNGLGIDTEANYWQRPVAGLGTEPLWTGDLNLLYSFPPHPRFKLRSGAGLAWTVDDGNFRGGYNITHGVDVYLLWRAMVTGEIDWGAIGSDSLFRYRLAFGLTFEFCELYTGYESYKLGNERLDGWVNGIAFWY